MLQQNISSCAWQESQTNKNQVKPIHFKKILSFTVENGWPVTKEQKEQNWEKRKKKRKKKGPKNVRLQNFLEKKIVGFLYYNLVLKTHKNYGQKFWFDMYGVCVCVCVCVMYVIYNNRR